MSETTVMPLPGTRYLHHVSYLMLTKSISADLTRSHSRKDRLVCRHQAAESFPLRSQQAGLHRLSARTHRNHPRQLKDMGILLFGCHQGA